MNKSKLLLFFIFLGIFATAFQIGSMSTISEEEANAFMKEFENLILDIDAFGIFTHNTTIAFWRSLRPGTTWLEVASSQPVATNIPINNAICRH